MPKRDPKPHAAPTAAPTFDEAIQTLIAAGWRELWRTMPSRKDLADPDAVHDVRVAARRLRSVMDMGTACFPQRWFRRWHRRAKAIADTFGTLRDADVMLETLHTLRAAAPAAEIAGLDDLIAQQAQVRADALSAAWHARKRFARQHLKRASRKRFPPPSRRTVKVVQRVLALQGER